MKSITIRTVQGIGDIFWVYQKVAPHVDEIHLRIGVMWDNDVQKRAQTFSALLPKVKSVALEYMDIEVYNRIAKIHRPVTDILLEGLNGRVVDYSVNNPLEHGYCLYNIDSMAVESYVPLEQVIDTNFKGNYLCMFVSGTNTHDYVWRPDQWATLAAELVQRIGAAEVVLIGASWDFEMSLRVQESLEQLGVKVRNNSGAMGIAATTQVIKASKYFFGYQSGLNVIAENYNVPQLMVYFPWLTLMMYTWCKPESVRTRFNAVTFDDSKVAFDKQKSYRRYLDDIQLPN